MTLQNRNGSNIGTPIWLRYPVGDDVAVQPTTPTSRSRRPPSRASTHLVGRRHHAAYKRQRGKSRSEGRGRQTFRSLHLVARLTARDVRIERLPATLLSHFVRLWARVYAIPRCASLAESIRQTDTERSFKKKPQPGGSELGLERLAASHSTVMLAWPAGKVCAESNLGTEKSCPSAAPAPASGR
jgi:hypothetical protein